MKNAFAALLSALALQAFPAPRSAAAEGAPAFRIDSEIGAARELALESGQNRLLIISQPLGRISVADPTIADLKVVTPNQVLLTAKNVGATDLTVWNRADEPLVIALQVSRSLDGLRKQLDRLFPFEKITVQGAGDLVVLSGETSDVRMPERIAEVARLHSKQVANLIKVSGNQQVQIEVKFAEVSRSGLRDIGFNFFYKGLERVGGITGNGANPGNFLNSLTPPYIPGTGPHGFLPNLQPPDVHAPQFQNQGFSLFFSNFPTFPFSVMMSLLESNGLAKTLAEPNLVTMSGQEAKFTAGGEIPIPLASSLGSVSIEWKKFGILLAFTPTVIDRDTVNLKLSTEVSDIDPTIQVVIQGSTVPGLVMRQSETTVRLGNGQSFAIAGLLSDKVRSTVDRVPVLGSIPILGALFRSSQYQRQETELLVVVTARLAEPVAPHQLPPLPTAYERNDPSDAAFFLLGSQGSSVTPSHPGGPSGAAGFTR
jgi:pilus assembly protein CpaC